MKDKHFFVTVLHYIFVQYFWVSNAAAVMNFYSYLSNPLKWKGK